MPQIDITQYAAMPQADLETMRRNLVAKAAGSHENLTEDDLHILAAVTGVLRRKSSGPPKEAKKASTKAPKVKATIDDLA